MKKQLFTLALLATCGIMPANSQNFEDFFENKTLRLDYLFNGNANSQNISLDELVSYPEWAGRRHSLGKIPVEGNGQITVKDKKTGAIIYRTSFSSLFQEWVTEEEAKHVTRGFENSYLIPFPKEDAIVTIELKDKYHKTSASLTQL